jgi:hypothetical protein
VGQIVTIKGTVNADGTTTVAGEVSVAGELRGPVSQVDLANYTVTVLGQVVEVTDATVLDEDIQSGDISSLTASTLIQVSGFPNVAGNLVASRIDLLAAGTPLQVEGIVSELDATTTSFRLNQLRVSYASAMLEGTLANDAVVIVQGTGQDGAGSLIATRVQVIPSVTPAANDRGKVEGIITSFTSNTSFSVNGQQVSTDANTQFQLNGVTLALDVPVKVTGTYAAGGTLAASKVKVKQSSLSVVRGLVDAVSAAAGTLTVLGIPVTTSSVTSFEDRAPQPLRSFQLSDLRTGDYVEIRGATTPNGSGLLATAVERQRPEDRAYLQGVALNVLSPGFTLLGIVVTTNAQTHFLGLGGPTVAPGAFFSQAAGRAVRVRGQMVGGVFVADRAQIRH